MLKFIYNGLKVNDTLYPAHYSIGPYTPESGLSNDTITIYARNYKHFPSIAGLTITNDSDIMTDYHETDRIRVTPSNKYYKDILNAYAKQIEHNLKRNNKHA